MNRDFGTRAWGRRRSGKVTGAERLGMALQGVRAVLAARLQRGALPELRVDLRPPSSALCARAEALLEETSPPWLVQHGYRTFSFARLLAARDGLRFDDELLYCASLLHDLGLTARYLPLEGACFALHGADEAEAQLRAAGMAPERAAVVAEAIALHLNLAVALQPHGAEAYLLRAATALDVVGQGSRALGPAMRAEVLAAHPRGSFKDGVCAAMSAQARRSPATRIGFLVHRLRLVDRARAAPFGS